MLAKDKEMDNGMKKRIRVNKNNVFLTLLFNICILLIVAMVAVAFLASTALRSFTSDCNQNDETTEKIAKIVENSIQEQERLISIYGNQIYQDRNETEEELKQRLQEFALLGTFDTVYLMKQSGEVVTGEVNKVAEIDNEKLYQDLLQTKYLNKIYQGSDDKIVYSYHIKINNENVGWILGTQDALINSEELGENLEDGSGVFYLLDENKNVVLYTTREGFKFKYSDIPTQNFYSSGDDINEQTGKILMALGNTEGNTETEADQTEIKWNGIKQLIGKESVFWYEKDVYVNRAQTFTALYGKIAYPSKDTIDTVRIGGLLVFFLLTVFLLLIVLLIVSQASSNRKIAKMAYLDSITGWPNWNKFQIDAAKLIKKRKKRMYAMIAFDIHQFRIINELDGYQMGEEVLRQISGLLGAKLRKKEIFTRFAVDDFVLLLRYATKEELEERVKKIDSILCMNTAIKGIRFNYGIYFIEQYDMDINRMYICSAMAKDSIKGEQGKHIGMFTNKLHDAILRDKELENYMEEALRKREFLVYLQPKYSTDGTRIRGAEALVRWNSPTLGFISPGEFIPLFEKNGFIMALDDYMLKAVCRIQKEWLNQGRQIITISVNVSRVHMLDPLLADKIKACVDEYQVPYQYIELELTESAFFEDKTVILDTVKKLQEIGFKVSMDDFGSGYSSLNSLKDLSLDVIKLDRDFFINNGNISRGEIVIKDTISLAKHLDMEIVAEGIETKEQVDFLKELGCDLIQGYYFAKPMPVKEFENLIGYDRNAK